MAQYRHLQSIQLSPVIPTVHIEYLDTNPGAVQALKLLQHELTEMAAVTAVQAQLEHGLLAQVFGYRGGPGPLPQRSGNHFCRTRRNLTDSRHEVAPGHCRIGIRGTHA